MFPLKKFSQFVFALALGLSANTYAGLLEAVVFKVAHQALQTHEHQNQSQRQHHASTANVAQDGGLGGVGFSHCANLFPNNSPVDVTALQRKWKTVSLCSNHFAVLNSTVTKTPLFVVEKLNKSLLQDAQGEERTNEFFPDPRIAVGDRAELVDFKASGYDRGHLANAADQPDQQSMVQSFALSNMVPQDPVNNRKGAWLKAEIDTRKYARRAVGDVYVFSGPLFEGEAKKIGPNKVWVPSHLFKLVFDANSGKSWAHIVSNTAEATLGAPISYEQFKQQTGLDLLPGVQAQAF